MKYEFNTAAELLALCHEEGLTISEVMICREMELGGVSRESIMDELDARLRVMNTAIEKSIIEPEDSMGGLLGGQAQKVYKLDRDKRICGSTLHKAIVNALAVAETNASMGVIVAAPTAGSAGVLPGALISVYSDLDLPVETLRHGLVNASAIGYLCTQNGSVSGAEAGCQAEVGCASAMAASALCEMLGGTPEQSLHAASVALSNLLGMVCDPVRGLVEVPCQTRNTIGVAGAFTAAEIALSGVPFMVDLDNMIRIMNEVGRTLPESLRETGKGGCASCSACQ